MALPTPPIHTRKPSERGKRFKRSFAQSTYITVAWTWFLVLAGKAAEPVLVVSVLYASLKLLPIVHFPPQFDAVVFVAQFVALDVGGLSLNKLADQALKDGNVEGARQAKWLSIALVSVMLAGVIIAGIDQVVKLDSQISTVIDTVLLIARAIMAVLYSRVIHALKPDDLFEHQPFNNGEEAQEMLRAAANEAVTMLTTQFQADQVALFQALSQRLEQQLHRLDMKQDTVFTSMQEQQAQALAALNSDVLSQAVMSHLETVLPQRLLVSPTASETRQIQSRETQRVPQTHVPQTHVPQMPVPQTHVPQTHVPQMPVPQTHVSQTHVPQMPVPQTHVSQTRVPQTHVPQMPVSRMQSRETQRVPRMPVPRKQEPYVVSNFETRKNEIDAAVWPLLDADKTVRSIEEETGIKKATVGRSRLRWVAARNIVSDSNSETDSLSHEIPADDVHDYKSGEENTS